MIGPFRGGRTVGATGVRGQPNVFYVGVNNGGVWKTTDFGRTWNPIFDDQPTGSVGTVAVAPSDPNILYVGSGEGLQRPDLSTGDGIYKSADAGKTWTHMGLDDAQQIGSILIDPSDPNRVFVAALGHPYGPNAERGVFRSTDGGKSWQKVLYKDENTGAIALAFDPTNPQTIYADLWAARQAPWENGAFQGPGSGLFKSIDGGTTWRQLTTGLPTTAQGLGRIGFAIAPSDAKRMYAVVDAGPLTGIYRSDDAGESWRRTNSESRVSGRGSDFAEVKVDPRNPDVIYVANTSAYKSTDGGAGFAAWKGAPGGDDYHTVWINPDVPQIILLAVDQGATITVNGGETWSSWYNQPTAQMYHVITDNQVPYWVYGAQQESGSVGIASRGDYGQITFADWMPIGVEEYGYVAPDPLDPNIIYGGKASRWDKRTRQTQNISPNVTRGGGKYRFLRTMPILFSYVDPHVLYLAGNVLFKTTTGGKSWTVISPDLTRTTDSTAPPNIGVFSDQAQAKAHHGGVIYAVAPSRKTVNTIWAGSDDGLIHLTRDGGAHWANVTPKELTTWAKVSQLESSHFDDNTVYAAINSFRLDDLKPHIYRTHDGGKTWTHTTTGIPDNEGAVNSVREDPVRKGMLFAGTERQVYVSFDDGDHWQSLRLNMPASSIRDLVIHDADVIVGTHGRSFWILDDISRVRQLDGNAMVVDAHLYKPRLTYRMRRNSWSDTPLPPEEPAGQNPPDGAILDYFLRNDAPGAVAIELLDASNKLVRRFSSEDKPDTVDAKDINVPYYWVRLPKHLSAAAGMHRWVWDLRYPTPEVTSRDFPISAIYHDTPREPLGAFALPGRYTVKLTVNGQSTTQPLVLTMDPRVKTSPAALTQQFTIAKGVQDALHEVAVATEQARTLRVQLRALREKTAPAPLADAVAATERRVTVLAGVGGGGGGRGGPPTAGAGTFAQLSAELTQLLNVIDGSDEPPTRQAMAAFAELQKSLAALSSKWREFMAKDITGLNTQLRAAGMAELISK